MDKQKRTLALGALALIALAAVYFLFIRDSGATLSDQDKKNMQALQDAAQKDSGPPPVKFVEPPVKPATGSREIIH